MSCFPSFVVFSLIQYITFVTAAEPSPSPLASPQLVFAAELCRHGDRTPLKHFPVDSFPAPKWPEGLGELTSIGQRAQYELGQRLRARYVDSGFLPESFSPRHVYIRSTDIDRTLVSATSQLAGLYPPGTAPNSDVRVRFGKDPLHENEGGLPHLYQPVPIHSTSTDTETLLIPGANCPRHEFLVQQSLHTPEFKSKIASERSFLRTAARIAGADASNFTIFDLDHLSDTWTCFAAHSVPLPPGATPAVVEHARNLSNWMLTYGNKGLEIHRLRAGLILHEIRRRVTIAALRELNRLPAAKADDAKKFVLFSAHDTTLAATLSALQVFDGKYPHYNSTIIWELFKTTDKKFLVRVEYNGKVLRLPGCADGYCSLEEYFLSTSERTVPGQDARFVECLIGWRRYTAMTANLFKRSGSDVDALPLLDNEQGSDHGWGAGVFIHIALALVMAVVAIAVFIRMRARYKGYAPTATEPMLPSRQVIPGNAQGLSDGPILM